jgi:hypothetical protein
LFIQAQQLQSQHLDVFVQQQVVPSTSTATTPTSSTTTTTSKDDDECGSRKFWRSRSRRGQIGIHIEPLLGGEIESRPRNRRERAEQKVSSSKIWTLRESTADAFETSGVNHPFEKSARRYRVM